jgi:uncharacterized protein YlaI
MNIASLNFNKNMVLGQFVPETILYELATGIDTRLVLLPNYFLQTREQKYILDYPYILFWNKPINLFELDCRVIGKDYAEKDFADSILTSTQKTRCLYCKNNYLTLVANPVDFFITKRNYVEEKLRNFKTYLCPNCKNSLKQYVIKFLETAKPFDVQWN